MTVYRQIAIDARTELADKSYQERVRAGHGLAEMSSYVECVERLFDDSGLSFALESSSVFGPEVDEQLRLLGRFVDSVDGSQTIELLLRDPMSRNVNCHA